MNYTEEQIWDLLKTIPDPEIPVISIVELGVVRKVECHPDSNVTVFITPTYSGCPALKAMEDQVYQMLAGKGIKAKVQTIYHPAWTTDWIGAEALEKLRVYGIAPPGKTSTAMLHPLHRLPGDPVPCPFCRSKNTTLTSQFGSTACKALYFCDACNQPFEHFKCH